MTELIHTAIGAAIDAGKEILQVYHTNDFQVQTKSDNSPLTLADVKAHEQIRAQLSELNIPILSEEGKNISYSQRCQWERFWLVDPLDGTKEFIKRNGEFTVNIAFIQQNRSVAGIIYVPVFDILYFGNQEIGAFKLKNATKFRENEKRHDRIKYAEKLPLRVEKNCYSVLASRTHISYETQDFIRKLEEKHTKINMVSKGSSLKFCMIAEGFADIYPRFGDTMEWDTAAGQAIVEAAGGKVVNQKTNKTLIYNKKDLRNPFFIAYK